MKTTASIPMQRKKKNVHHLAGLFDFTLEWITAKTTHQALATAWIWQSCLTPVASQLKRVVSKLRCWVRKLIRHRLSKWCEHMWSKDCKMDPVPQRKRRSPKSKPAGSL